MKIVFRLILHGYRFTRWCAAANRRGVPRPTRRTWSDEIDGKEASPPRARQRHRAPAENTQTPTGREQVEAGWSRRQSPRWTETVSPITTGAKCAAGPDALRGSVRANTTRAKIMVPNVSARKAAGSETKALCRSCSAREYRCGRAGQRSGAGKILTVAHRGHFAAGLAREAASFSSSASPSTTAQKSASASLPPR